MWVCVVRVCSNLLTYMWLSSFPNISCWRDCLYGRLIDHRCMGLFLGSLFCSIDHICFCANTSSFWLLQLCSIVWNQWGGVMHPALLFVLFHQDFSGNSGSFMLSYNFMIVLVQLKKCNGWFDRDCLNLLEKAMATHSSTPAWKMTWMEEPGRLQSMGLRRVGHD